MYGDGAEAVLGAIDCAARDHGYAMHRQGASLIYVRGEQKLSVTPLRGGRFRIVEDDVASLPISGLARDGIRVGPISIAVAATIVPLRERHDPGTNLWEAQWRILDGLLLDLAAEIERSLVAQGLRSYGIFRVDVERYCSLEASSADRLVRVCMHGAEASVLVDVAVVDGPGAIERQRGR